MSASKHTGADLDRALESVDSVRREASRDREYGFDDDWNTFMKRMRLLTAQASGARIQNYLIRLFGWTKVSANEDRGDAKDGSGQYFEVKVSVISTSNPLANIVQIRPWQKIAGHHIFVIDSTHDYEVTHFFLNEEHMREEIRLCGQSAHGTKAANKENRNKEWAIRVLWDERDGTRQRWMKKYRQDTVLK